MCIRNGRKEGKEGEREEGWGRSEQARAEKRRK